MLRNEILGSRIVKILIVFMANFVITLSDFHCFKSTNHIDMKSIDFISIINCVFFRRLFLFIFTYDLNLHSQLETPVNIHESNSKL